jgi:hypothetical protein
MILGGPSTSKGSNSGAASVSSTSGASTASASASLSARPVTIAAITEVELFEDDRKQLCPVFSIDVRTTTSRWRCQKTLERYVICAQYVVVPDWPVILNVCCGLQGWSL